MGLAGTHSSPVAAGAGFRSDFFSGLLAALGRSLCSGSPEKPTCKCANGTMESDDDGRI